MPLELTSHHTDAAKPSVPIPQAQPESLAALAGLRGMAATDPDHASVLELGCGDGSNLIPLAERYPQARFVGVDPSAHAIKRAQTEVDELGFKNVELRHQPLAELGADLGLFDYMIADGLYSWHGRSMADKLMGVCRNHLAPRGVAYVSYLTYPGWQVHELLGSMMRYEVGGTRSPAEQVAAARMLLEFLKTCLPTEDQPYALLLRPELERLTAQPDAYLERNYLNPHCSAVYFHQFVAHAGRHRLQLLGDCSLGARLSDTLGVPLEQELQTVAPDATIREQLRDVLRNRAGRQSLLCHEAVALQSSPDPSRLSGLYLEGRLQAADPNAAIESTAVGNFIAPGGLSVATSVPVVKAALVQLGAAWPGYVLFDDLVTESCRRVVAGGAEAPAADVERLKQNLLQCCTAGVVKIHASRPAFVPEPTDRPTVSPLARRQATRGPVMTNRRHESIQLDVFDRHLFHLLDGTRSVSQLVEHLAASAAAGQMMAVENNQPVPPERLHQFLRDAVVQSLKRLAQNAFLVA